MASPFELEFGDSPFDGYPRNFADAKALIYARSKKAGVAWIAAAGEGLLKAKGKLSSTDYEDDDKLEEFFTEETNYFKTLPVIKMMACKKAIDTKSELYTSLNNQGKKDLQASTLEMYFQDANCSVIHALREYFAPRDCAKQASSKRSPASLAKRKPGGARTICASSSSRPAPWATESQCSKAKSAISRSTRRDILLQVPTTECERNFSSGGVHYAHAANISAVQGEFLLRGSSH